MSAPFTVCYTSHQLALHEVDFFHSAVLFMRNPVVFTYSITTFFLVLKMCHYSDSYTLDC
jgi:hypothetical protein